MAGSGLPAGLRSSLAPDRRGQPRPGLPARRLPTHVGATNPDRRRSMDRAPRLKPQAQPSHVVDAVCCRPPFYSGGYETKSPPFVGLGLQEQALESYTTIRSDPIPVPWFAMYSSLDWVTGDRRTAHRGLLQMEGEDLSPQRGTASDQAGYGQRACCGGARQFGDRWVSAVEGRHSHGALSWGLLVCDIESTARRHIGYARDFEDRL